MFRTKETNKQRNLTFLFDINVYCETNINTFANFAQ